MRLEASLELKLQFGLFRAVNHLAHPPYARGSGSTRAVGASRTRLRLRPRLRLLRFRPSGDDPYAVGAALPPIGVACGHRFDLICFGGLAPRRQELDAKRGPAGFPGLPPLLRSVVQAG